MMSTFPPLQGNDLPLLSSGEKFGQVHVLQDPGVAQQVNAVGPITNQVEGEVRHISHLQVESVNQF